MIIRDGEQRGRKAECQRGEYWENVLLSELPYSGWRYRVLVSWQAQAALKMHFISLFVPSNFSVTLQVLVQSLLCLHSLHHRSGMMPFVIFFWL